MEKPKSALSPLEQSVVDSYRKLTRGVDFLPNIKFPEIKPLDVQRADSFFGGVKELIDQMRRALQPDQQLQIYYFSGFEVIEVRELAMRSTQLIVVAGKDEKGNNTVHMSHINAFQLTCKVAKASSKKDDIKSALSLSKCPVM